MNMFVLPIWGSNHRDDQMRAALAAGWQRSDLWWERLQEQANCNWINGRRVKAQWQFRIAWWLSSMAFTRTDARQVTSLANMAISARRRGAETLAQRRYARAIKHWALVPAGLTDMQISPRARSSLFHLRMEARYRDTYHANMQKRIGLIIAESAKCLQALAAAQPLPHRLYTRWKGEKPTVYDDTRKLLAACLLLASDN
jgi:hypothetical protein